MCAYTFNLIRSLTIYPYTTMLSTLLPRTALRTTTPLARASLSTSAIRCNAGTANKKEASELIASHQAPGPAVVHESAREIAADVVSDAPGTCILTFQILAGRLCYGGHGGPIAPLAMVEVLGVRDRDVGSIRLSLHWGMGSLDIEGYGTTSTVSFLASGRSRCHQGE